VEGDGTFVLLSDTLKVWKYPCWPSYAASVVLQEGDLVKLNQVAQYKAVWDKADAPDVKAKKKRKTFNLDVLLDEKKGMPRIVEVFPKLKFKGPGYEVWRCCHFNSASSSGCAFNFVCLGFLSNGNTLFNLSFSARICTSCCNRTASGASTSSQR